MRLSRGRRTCRVFAISVLSCPTGEVDDGLSDDAFMAVIGDRIRILRRELYRTVACSDSLTSEAVLATSRELDRLILAYMDQSPDPECAEAAT